MALNAKTANHPDTRINPALFPVQESGRQEFLGAVAADGHLAGGLANAIAEFIGARTDTTRSMALTGGVPVHQGPPATTTSLTKVFEGTAEVRGAARHRSAPLFCGWDGPLRGDVLTRISILLCR